jgi:hypothetical protein
MPVQTPACPGKSSVDVGICVPTPSFPRAMTKFLLLIKYEASLDITPMTGWTPEDTESHVEFLHSVNRSRAALTGPNLAKTVGDEARPGVHAMMPDDQEMAGLLAADPGAVRPALSG